MIQFLPQLIGVIPSIVKLFSSDERKQGVKEITDRVLSEASKSLGVTFSSKEDLMSHLNANPQEVINLKEIEKDSKEMMLKYNLLEAQEDTKILQSVNETIRTEVKSEHWVSYTWRPFIGFSFGLYVNSLWLLPAFGKTPTVMTVDMIITIGAILGVASWHRGMKQIKQVEKGK